jgi:very-short-patch-repair endonuclease
MLNVKQVDKVLTAEVKTYKCLCGCGTLLNRFGYVKGHGFRHYHGRFRKEHPQLYKEQRLAATRKAAAVSVAKNGAWTSYNVKFKTKHPRIYRKQRLKAAKNGGVANRIKNGGWSSFHKFLKERDPEEYYAKLQKSHIAGGKAPKSESWRRNMSISRRKYIQDHPEQFGGTHFNRGRVSKSEVLFESILQEALQLLSRQVTLSYEREMAVRTNRSTRFLDFGIEVLKLDFEVDGDYRHFLECGRNRDGRRTKELNAVGWRVYRFKGNDIKLNPDKLVRKIVTAVMRYI